MGNYTIRTNDEQDAMIRDVAQYMDEATVSKAFLTALSTFKEHRETIFKLRRELEQERQRTQKMSGAINDFENSMTRMFAIK